MSVILSQKAANLKTSPTLALVAKAKELQAKGFDVISLTVGEPDWPTIEVASQAGIKAIQTGFTKYTAANGTIELRKAIAQKMMNEIGVEYAPNDVMVGPGAKFVIFSALQMICDAGDEVIINSPYWVSYPTMIELSGGLPKIVDCDQSTNFKLTAEGLAQAMSPKTKGFLFCSPSNPTGLMYTTEELKKIADVLRQHPRVVILSDDIYNRLVFGGGRVAPHLLQVAPDLRDRVVCINGGSKAYSMTGWRIGWAAGPSNLIRAMGDYQSQATGAPSSISQQAALAALGAPDSEINKVVQLLETRLVKAVGALEKVPGLKPTKPDGAFYLWVDVKAHIGKSHKGTKILSDKEFCDILLNEYHVATVPGTECGSLGYMRLSFATSEDKFAQAAERMAKMIAAMG